MKRAIAKCGILSVIMIFLGGCAAIDRRRSEPPRIVGYGDTKEKRVIEGGRLQLAEVHTGALGPHEVKLDGRAMCVLQCHGWQEREVRIEQVCWVASIPDHPIWYPERRVRRSTKVEKMNSTRETIRHIPRELRIQYLRGQEMTCRVDEAGHFEVTIPFSNTNVQPLSSKKGYSVIEDALEIRILPAGRPPKGLSPDCLKQLKPHVLQVPCYYYAAEVDLVGED